MITGSCLCGGVRWEFERLRGDFEICHCSRCRKSSGSAFLPMLGVDPAGFRFAAGAELVRSYEAPILRSPPAFRTNFCSLCGSPAPNPEVPSDFFEVPAGCLDDAPGSLPDRHICVELKAPWFQIRDELPQLDMPALRKHRIAASKAAAAAEGSPGSCADSEAGE
jgi:hypothetical protein